MLEPWALARSRWKKKIAWHAWIHALVQIERAPCTRSATKRRFRWRGWRRMFRFASFRTAFICQNCGLRDEFIQTGNVLLFLGRIHPKKGLEPLIEAWAQVPAVAQSGWRLAIAGWDDGGHQARLSARVRGLRIQDSVTFLGPTFGEAKERALRSASAFILPSFSEGLPMAVLEAWSFAVPVIMTDECHLEIGFASGAAIRVEPTVPSLAANLADIALRRSPLELRAMGMRGRRLVESEFAWGRIGNDMADVYDWAVGGPPPSCMRF